jgi:hypothetical protein
LNFSLLSAVSIARLLAPINSTLYFFNIPLSYSSIAILRAVCPPTVGNIACGFSFLIIASTYSLVIGSIYVLSENCGSVIIVAGLELIKITL